MGKFSIQDFSLTSICDKVFETLESKFDNSITKYLISLIAASRVGLMETEIIKLLTQSGLVKGMLLYVSKNRLGCDFYFCQFFNIDILGSAQKLWIQFCWVMGPMLLHTTLVKLIDKKLKTIATKRYETDVKIAHNILLEFYRKQENLIQDKKKKHKW